MTQDERHQLVGALAEVIAGLQVPYSIDKRVLGTAAVGWLKVWQQLDLDFGGWQDAEAIRLRLAAALLDE